ncbi:MAG: hypothetical protein LOD90_02955 [Symbiobacteriaceae bacterium]|nr:MAG: hypothetical protein DIU69_04040 [Bacillota bacterium]
MRCPVCGGNATGKIGTGEYYCWDCCIEFQERGGGTFACFVLDSEGNRVAFHGAAPGSAGPASHVAGDEG